MNRTILTALLAAALALPARPAHAIEGGCPVDGATPFLAGPVSPTNGFAEYVTDSNGVALEICTDPALCFFDPVVAGNLFSEQIGFGAEGFWWLADTTIDTAAPLSAVLVLAAEAAFNTELPAPGDQFPFTRLRLRMDVPSVGIYTVTHPYGQFQFVVDAIGAGREINESFDIQFTPGTQNQGRVGPWLVWDASEPAAPAGFVGDGATPHTVTGSPCGTNHLAIEAIGLDGLSPVAIDPDDLDQDGRTDRVQTNLFIVNGKQFDGRVGTPLLSDRSTYDRSATGAQLDVFATSTGTASVTVASGALSLPLFTDGGPNYFLSLALGDANAIPAVVAVTAAETGEAPATDPTRLLRLVTDVVRITRAEYDLANQALFVEATSSDALANPSLTVVEYGRPVGTIIPTPAPPATVSVVSSGGGVDTEQVTVVTGVIVVPTPPVAVDDAVTTPEDVEVTIDVLANDFDPDGVDVISVFSVGTPSNGTVKNNGTSVTYTPAPNFAGVDSFTYVVADTRGGISEPAVVTVTVDGRNDAPVAGNDAFTIDEDVATIIPVLANDSDPDGNALSVSAVGDAVNGTVELGADGTVVFTPSPNFSGNASFGYTITDGALSASATVAVTVSPVNDAPVANSESASTFSGQSVTVAVLANDTDIDGPAPLAVVNITPPQAGSFVLNADQTITYTAAANFVGVATIGYDVRDGAGAVSNQAQLSVTVTAAPVDLDIALTVPARARVGRETITPVVRITNGGSINAQRTATLTATLNGVQVYSVARLVSDPVGNGSTSFNFPTYTPTTVGTLLWTASVEDDLPSPPDQADVVQATTTLRR